MRFANYQAIAEYGIRGRRSLSGRTALYRPRDFEGATVLDLGCNIGQMMYQAKKWRAKEVIGVEIEPRFVRKARLLSDSRVILGNLDWQATWDRIPRCDVVLVLALIYWIRDPSKFMQRACSKTKRVMYFEGHPKRRLPDDYRRMLFPHTNFSKVERLGETPPRRPFFRLSYE